MPLYVHLVQMTREGAGKIRDLAAEYGKVRQYRESLGCEDTLYGSVGFGEYDFVAALKAAGYAASTGNVQLQTLPACQIEDFFKVMSELPR